VIDRNGTPKPFRAWKDTVNINPGEVVRLRTRYNDFAGKTVFHCHILDHEDSGMMGILAIEAEASSA
jgi:FtsP/CotA-like multicopper oxidase with cupredoxin domain